jgi:hypothetical protein
MRVRLFHQRKRRPIRGNSADVRGTRAYARFTQLTFGQCLRCQNPAPRTRRLGNLARSFMPA